MTTKSRKKIIVTVVAFVLLALIIWTLWGNTALELNTYKITSDRLPKEFSGYRIAHISDLHNAEMGKENKKLISMLKETEPDIIAITGDMIDSRRTNIDIALQFAEKAAKIAPCYYVTGNHESRISEYKNFKQGLEKLGVTVLEDERITLKKQEAEITLMGIEDPTFDPDNFYNGSQSVMESKLKELIKDSGSYTVLLSHRPERFDTYTKYKLDLVLTGHAHGGQVRLPFVGGLLAPNQGWFPEYDSGLYTQNSTNMIVSRGIGNSVIPLRFNNRPELILIELQSEQ